MINNENMDDYMFSGKKVVLRALEMSDLDDILTSWNNWDLRRYIQNNLPDSRLAEEEWLTRACKNQLFSDGVVHFAIIDKIDRKILGTCGLFRLNSHSRRVELGIAILDRENFDKGYGTDATQVLLWVAFHVYNLHTVHLQVINSNKRGIRAYEKSGFQKTGLFREAFYTEGKYHDVVLMDITKEDFYNFYPPGRFVHGK